MKIHEEEEEHEGGLFLLNTFMDLQVFLHVLHDKKTIWLSGKLKQQQDAKDSDGLRMVVNWPCIREVRAQFVVYK